jgi:hypothetical protein
MTPHWKPPKAERTDAEKVRRQRQFQQDMRDILEYGTEEDFVALVKKEKPDLGKEELRTLIKQFHAYAREKRGLCWQADGLRLPSGGTHLPTSVPLLQRVAG